MSEFTSFNPSLPRRVIAVIALAATLASAGLMKGGAAQASGREPRAAVCVPDAGVLPLDQPQAVAVDSAGNVYIDNFNGSEIDKLTPSGELSVFAGTGEAGSPTPGPATASELDYPIGLAADGLGNVYIDDAGNDVIEKVNPDGDLSIFAGILNHPGTPTAGIATSSELQSPIGLAADKIGDVYIADQGIEFGANNVIEKVNPAGELSIFAGETAASGMATPGPAVNSKLGYPQAVAVNKKGDVYIADTLNSAIEEVTPAGRLSIIAGDGFSSPPTPGPAKKSKLAGPDGVAVDNKGNVYVADSGNNMVERISPKGKLFIVAGTGQRGEPTRGQAVRSKLSLPVDVAVDSAGNVYIADTGNNDIVKVTPTYHLSVICR